MDSKEKEHLLSLKVMRLTRPSLFTALAVGSDARDLPGDHLNADLRSDMAIPQGIPNTGVGHILLLPQSFGNIYLGETFSCCICVHNDSQDLVRDVLVKAVLQMSNQRVPLLGEDDAQGTELQAGANINQVIQHEVRDIGTHILVCAVSYTASSGESANFRKFYKFQVMKPLDVKTKFYNTESDEVYLETGVQNITSGPICLEKVELEASAYFTDESRQSVFGPINVLNPHDTRQYLYCLKPKPETRTTSSAMKQATTVGKLDIVWRTNIGDRGRLQTSQLQRTAPQYGDVQVSVLKIPNIVQLEVPFNITLSFTNICERSLDLYLEFINGGGCVEWTGVVSRDINTLQTGEAAIFELSLVPLRMGLQTISGVRLTDTFLKRTYDYEKLAQVLVTNNKLT
ncbi:trafficking protein particle complex subunit 13 isoform X2 [Oratosquilla oratoria]|uniref:trafficking protein particle complex subunit 13 isoform X2 n=1 Tax=Oratosquilla oratoria TaxID=337810 RepID=UPI003F770546